MRRFDFRRGVAVACAALAAAVVGTLGSALGAGAERVIVRNSETQPVPTTIQGTPTVNVAGTPSVNVANTPTVGIDPAANTVQVADLPPAPTPFQIVETYDTLAGLTCHQITMPSGQTSTVQNVGVFAQGTVAGSSWFLRVRTPGVVAPAYPIEMVSGSGTVRGQIATTILAGSVGGSTHNLDLCSTTEAGVNVDVIVTGLRQPAV